jgi:hypothetical protein
MTITTAPLMVLVYSQLPGGEQMGVLYKITIPPLRICQSLEKSGFPK